MFNEQHSFMGMSDYFLWSKLLNYMATRLGDDTIIEVWFKDVTVKKLTENEIVLLVPGDFQRVIVQKRCVYFLQQAFKELYNKPGFSILVCGPDSVNASS